MRLVTSLGFRGWALLGAAALCIALPGLAAPGGPANAGATLEERKMPMRFSWIACEPNCGGWISAVGIVTADSPRDFDEFAQGRDLGGATIVLDSSGGSVNDSITLGRRWRSLGLLTTVGINVQRLNLLYLEMFALTVALGLRYLGVLLMGSLIIIPAATAKRLSGNLNQMLATAAIIAVAVTVAGSVVASSLHRATGPIIVSLAAAGFFLSFLVAERSA